MNRAAHNARLSALIGAGFWLVMLLIRTGDSNETELIQKILLLGILVIVPLGLSLIPIAQAETDSILYRAAVSAQPVGAVASAFSFLLALVHLRQSWACRGCWLRRSSGCLASGGC